MNLPESQRLGNGDVDGIPTFPFLQLPRELRDQIYDYTFSICDPRGDRALGIERRNLKYFEPSPASILLLLHHEYLLLNRQIAREALEILFKNHTVFLSCGPYVLKQLLSRIEEKGGPYRQYLKWLKRIELDWVTFPNLRTYPPERSEGKDEWWWERDGQEIDVDYVRGAQYSGHYDEHDYEGGYYDDNLYEAEDDAFYPPWPQQHPHFDSTATDDLSDFASFYPFADPSASSPSHAEDRHIPALEIDSRLDLLIAMEAIPLFTYLSTPTFSLQSIALPLYFISKESLRARSAASPSRALPLKIRYWVHMCVHALLMLHATPSLLEVRVKYMPWDIWASMEPADDLARMVERGIWFRSREDEDDEDDEGEGGEREGEGEAFRGVWKGLRERGLCKGEDRMGLKAEVRLLKWEGDLDRWRVGDELEVVFTRDRDRDKEAMMSG